MSVTYGHTPDPAKPKYSVGQHLWWDENQQWVEVYKIQKTVEKMWVRFRYYVKWTSVTGWREVDLVPESKLFLHPDECK